MADIRSGQPIVNAHQIRKYFERRCVLNDISFSLFADARVGIIGANGAGKSTLMKIIAGRDPEFDGNLVIQKGTHTELFDQEPELAEERTVLENIQDGIRYVYDLLERHDELVARMGESDAVDNEYAEVLDRIDFEQGWDIDRFVDIAMDALCCPPKDQIVSTLSGGEKRRVALCKILMGYPDLLLLDEPTNHLDAASVEWLLHFLAGYPGAVVMVTHDRYFLDQVAKHMCEIDYQGKINVFAGNYSDYLEQKEKSLAMQKRISQKRTQLIKKELEWVRSGVKARQTKQKARLQNFDRMCEEQHELARTQEYASFRIPTGPRLGNKVIDIDGVTKRFGDRTLFEDLSFSIPPGGIVGITGANGVGKTTLMKIIMGELEPDAGTVDIGSNTVFCYVDQNRDTLNADKTVFDEVSAGSEWVEVSGQQVHIRRYLSQFLFKGDIQQTPVGKLSGGERNWVQMAKLLRHGGNLLILDEPTNDLDLDTLRVLEEALLHFPGSAVVITHDRYFLDRIATHILAFEGNGDVRFSEGSYEIYKSLKRKREGGKAEGIGKAKYRKIEYRRQARG